MLAQTKVTLAELQEADLLANAGRPIQSSGIVVVKSWQEAMNLCTSKEWDNLRLEGENLLTEALSSRCRDRYNKTWNNTAIELNQLIAPVLTDKLDALARRGRLPKKVRQIIHCDVRAICMEAEYLDIVPAGWYTNHLKPWYLKGHLPCGWTGEFLREGTVMVF
jgi:hypothetical protein